jgi:hypothetical protein
MNSPKMSGDRSTYPSCYATSNEAAILQQVQDKEPFFNVNETQVPQRKRPRVDSGGAQGQIAATDLSLDFSTNRFSQSVARGKIRHFTSFGCVLKIVY